jgi:hypothetical protein
VVLVCGAAESVVSIELNLVPLRHARVTARPLSVDRTRVGHAPKPRGPGERIAAPPVGAAQSDR